MRHKISVGLIVSALFGGSVLLGQTSTSRGNASGGVTKAMLARVIAAWATMDVSKPAVFYAKDPGLAYYDIAPRKYNGWAEYEKGAADMFKTLKSLTLKVNDDAQVHNANNMAWATATVDGEMVAKDGARTKVDARWSTVWEKRGADWIIVHDHFSMPQPEPAPATKK
jgi:ketosteroid isomerase-like protein